MGLFKRLFKKKDCLEDSVFYQFHKNDIELTKKKLMKITFLLANYVYYMYDCSLIICYGKINIFRKEQTMKKIFTIIAGLTVIIILSSCANQIYSWSYSPINVKYAKQIDQVTLSMSKEELRKILPKLHVRGQTYVEGELIEALELQHNYWAGVGGYLIYDKLWFYFYNGQLVKWGQPNDWPQKPDLIIEKRYR